MSFISLECLVNIFAQKSIRTETGCTDVHPVPQTTPNPTLFCQTGNPVCTTGATPFFAIVALYSMLHDQKGLELIHRIQNVLRSMWENFFHGDCLDQMCGRFFFSLLSVRFREKSTFQLVNVHCSLL